MPFISCQGPVAIIPLLWCWRSWLYKAPLTESIEVLVKGAGNSNIITMCIIYLLGRRFCHCSSGNRRCRCGSQRGFIACPSAIFIARLIRNFGDNRDSYGHLNGGSWCFSPYSCGLKHTGTIRAGFSRRSSVKRRDFWR